MVWSRVLILVSVPLLGFSGGCKKKAPPKLSKSECTTFCKRLVPCFAPKMGMFAKKVEQDTRECIRDCGSQEGQRHGPILRAMKRCGHLTECNQLVQCFQKSLSHS